ncbi:MAG: flavin reductase family protein [Planctomycetes bacterium]|nr:flavin reductase family protein [Phycisphaerae bacterium]NBB94320.1 flavin reductase family protein [Planctomycetota bacterium]
MSREKVAYTRHYEAVMEKLTSHGLLLGSYDAAGNPNVMTIGWGTLGNVWGMPLWIVLVRPSRHTYHNIEYSGCFTVNVPGDELSYAAAVCGTKSGRDTDKFAECKLTAKRAGNVLAPAVAECPIVYECQVVHSNDILPTKLADEILSGAYVDGDYHRMYCGKILEVHAAPDAEARLK